MIQCRILGAVQLNSNLESKFKNFPQRGPGGHLRKAGQMAITGCHQSRESLIAVAESWEVLVHGFFLFPD